MRARHHLSLWSHSLSLKQEVRLTPLLLSQASWRGRTTGDPMGEYDIFDGVSVQSPGSIAVLRRCWLTAYNGTGLVVGAGAFGALLATTIANCLGGAVACDSSASLRARGCRLVCNNADVAAGPGAATHSLARHNVFAHNLPIPGTVDVFPYPPQRAYYAPGALVPPPAQELLPWSPAFTVAQEASEINQAPAAPEPAFPRVFGVALLT